MTRCEQAMELCSAETRDAPTSPGNESFAVPLPERRKNLTCCVFPVRAIVLRSTAHIARSPLLVEERRSVLRVGCRQVRHLPVSGAEVQRGHTEIKTLAGGERHAYLRLGKLIGSLRRWSYRQFTGRLRAAGGVRP